jgi:hypothetical protein
LVDESKLPFAIQLIDRVTRVFRKAFEFAAERCQQSLAVRDVGCPSDKLSQGFLVVTPRKKKDTFYKAFNDPPNAIKTKEYGQGNAAIQQDVFLTAFEVKHVFR